MTSEDSSKDVPETPAQQADSGAFNLLAYMHDTKHYPRQYAHAVDRTNDEVALVFDTYQANLDIRRGFSWGDKWFVDRLFLTNFIVWVEAEMERLTTPQPESEVEVEVGRTHPAMVMHTTHLRDAETAYTICGRINDSGDEMWTYYRGLVTCPPCKERMNVLPAARTMHYNGPLAAPPGHSVLAGAICGQAKKEDRVWNRPDKTTCLACLKMLWDAGVPGVHEFYAAEDTAIEVDATSAAYLRGFNDGFNKRDKEF